MIAEIVSSSMPMYWYSDAIGVAFTGFINEGKFYIPLGERSGLLIVFEGDFKVKENGSFIHSSTSKQGNGDASYNIRRN